MLLALAGLAAYLVFGHPSSGQPATAKGGSGGPASRSATPSRTPGIKVMTATTTGLVDFGPYDDGDSTVNDDDDHPLMLQVSGGALSFVPIPAAELVSGVPLWTADAMSDGSYIFIYIPTGQCLTAPATASTSPSASQGAGTGQPAPALAHCDLGLPQHWWPVNTTTAVGQTFSQFAAWNHSDCLTAGEAAPADQENPPVGPARLTACAPARSKAALPQEIAFFWGG